MAVAQCSKSSHGDLDLSGRADYSKGKGLTRVDLFGSVVSDSSAVFSLSVSA